VAERIQIRDRIVGLERVKARDLREHPLNPRRHPDGQKSAVSLLLREIGMADRLLAFRDAEGKLRLVDGHLRRDLLGDTEVAVLVTDLSEEEAALMVAVGDPLAGLAERDDAVMAELLAQTDQDLLAELLAGNDPLAELLGREQVPDFAPVGEDEQGRLDEKAKVTCPECGHAFTP